jgi:class 3 adenylate cyclase
MSSTGATAAFAFEMLREVERVREQTGVDVHIRIGLHVGRVVGGVIGKSRPRYLIWGEETLVGNLMESTGVVDGVQCSEAAARRLQREGFELEPLQVVDASGFDRDAVGSRVAGSALGSGVARVLDEAALRGGVSERARMINTSRLVGYSDSVPADGSR